MNKRVTVGVPLVLALLLLCQPLVIAEAAVLASKIDPLPKIMIAGILTSLLVYLLYLGQRFVAAYQSAQSPSQD